jgi:hypothetical protein
MKFGRWLPAFWRNVTLDHFYHGGGIGTYLPDCRRNTHFAEITWTVLLHPAPVMSVGPFALHFVHGSSWSLTDGCTHFVLEPQWRPQHTEFKKSSSLQSIHLVGTLVLQSSASCHWVDSEQVAWTAMRLICTEEVTRQFRSLPRHGLIWLKFFVIYLRPSMIVLQIKPWSYPVTSSLVRYSSSSVIWGYGLSYWRPSSRDYCTS